MEKEKYRQYTVDRAWSGYPLGTKAHAVMGGYWVKVSLGWKWCNGATFPTPGGDACGACIELPPRHACRRLFADAGLTYDHLTRKNLQRLRNLINREMIDSGLFNGTYRCHQRPIFRTKERFFAGIRCRAFYFNDREVVSFNPDGFIGFAGWASSSNEKPICDGFRCWLAEMKRSTRSRKRGE